MIFMVEPYKNKVKLKLKKAQGQVVFVQKMINEERPCLEISQQIHAVIGIIKSANAVILNYHIKKCTMDMLNSIKKDQQMKFLKELVNSFKIIK